MSRRLFGIRGAVCACMTVALFATAVCGATNPPGAPRGPASDGAKLPDSAQDIRDIRGPKFDLPNWLLPSILAGAILLALSSYCVWRWRRRRPRPVSLSPFEAALQRLETIRALMSPPRAAEFSVMVSDIVRSYIEQRFDVIATRRTTEEFLHDLLESPHSSLARHRALLGQFLRLCDFVKFGGLALTAQNMESLRQSARTFVLATAPVGEVGEPGKTDDSLSST